MSTVPNNQDQPQETEVMPGVFITDFRKTNNTNTTNIDTTTNENNNMDQDASKRTEDAIIELSARSLEQQVGQLEDEYHLLSAQLEDIKANRYKTIGELTGFTGVHLLEQIHLKMAELNNFHQHLLKSQEQIKDMLDLNDPDLNEAYEENKVVLLDQQHRMNLLRKEETEVLRQMGSHYAEPSPHDPTTKQNDDSLWL